MVAHVRPSGLPASDSDSDSGDGESSDGEGDTSDATLARRLADVRAEVDVLLAAVARRRRRRRRRRSERVLVDGVRASPNGLGGSGGGGSGGGHADIGGGSEATRDGASQVAERSDAAGTGNKPGERVDALSSAAAAVPGADSHSPLVPVATPSAGGDGAGGVGVPAAPPVTWRAADERSASNGDTGENSGGIGGAEGGTVGVDGGTTSVRGGSALDASEDEDDFMSMDPPDVSVFKHAAW